MASVAAAALSLVLIILLVRAIYIFGSNSIGELGQELLYLRGEAFRTPLVLVGIVFVIELLEFTYPLLLELRPIPEVPEIIVYVNAVQALILTAAAIMTVRVLRGYTEGGLDVRLRDTLDAIALLAGQRRRRRGERSERRATEPPEE